MTAGLSGGLTIRYHYHSLKQNHKWSYGLQSLENAITKYTFANAHTVVGSGVVTQS